MHGVQQINLYLLAECEDGALRELTWDGQSSAEEMQGRCRDEEEG
jgi:hypothetical protein